jgi:hypothetical protein
MLFWDGGTGTVDVRVRRVQCMCSYADCDSKFLFSFLSLPIAELSQNGGE